MDGVGALPTKHPACREIIPAFALAAILIFALWRIDKINWHNPALIIPVVNYLVLALAFVLMFYTEIILKKPVIIGWHGIGESIQDSFNRLEYFFIFFAAQSILLVLVYPFVEKEHEDIRLGLQVCIFINIMIILFGLVLFSLL